MASGLVKAAVRAHCHHEFGGHHCTEQSRWRTHIIHTDTQAPKHTMGDKGRGQKGEGKGCCAETKRLLAVGIAQFLVEFTDSSHVSASVICKDAHRNLHARGCTVSCHLMGVGGTVTPR